MDVRKKTVISRLNFNLSVFITGSDCVHYAVRIECLTLNIPRGVLKGPPLVYYWLTFVEINKHKTFDTNNA